MLVITRRNDESVMIGDQIEIIVSEINSDKVKLCIKAPKEIPIMRKELLELCGLNQEASNVPSKHDLDAFKALANALKKPANNNDEP
ncbi:MAG TPA: carbon storage regulator [Clostridiales bacterium]|nr:carbon storage regulator [Clostridiales bacterium]